MGLKFDGASGRKPQTEARRYVYSCLVTTLAEDIERAGYLHEDLEEEPDRRRALKAAPPVHPPRAHQESGGLGA
jgi:hypothetical protein